MTHEVPMLVSSLGCVLLLLLVLMVLLILLNLLYRRCKSLQKLHLHCDELIHRGIWVVVVATAVHAGSGDYWDLIECSPSVWLGSALPG
jgi:hypothetical protein